MLRPPRFSLFFFFFFFFFFRTTCKFIVCISWMRRMNAAVASLGVRQLPCLSTFGPSTATGTLKPRRIEAGSISPASESCWPSQLGCLSLVSQSLSLFPSRLGCNVNHPSLNDAGQPLLYSLSHMDLIKYLSFVP